MTIESVAIAIANPEPLEAWPEPVPLPSALPNVPEFDPRLLPSLVRPWTVDIAERMCVPIDYVAIPTMVGLGSVIGRRIGVRPEQHTPWTESANLWGAVVGSPGMLKSPAISQALQPVRALETLALRDFEQAKAEYELHQKLSKFEGDVTDRAIRAIYGDKEEEDKRGRALDLLRLEPEQKEPVCRRFMTTDATVEKLGEIAAANPMGILVARDELISLFRELDPNKNPTARGFYLSGWSGAENYKVDRITRGSIDIPSLALSLIGSTQPSVLARFIQESLAQGDDGMIARLQLLVWPNIVGAWRPNDRRPDLDARDDTLRLFDRLSQLTAADVDAVVDAPGPTAMPYLRFDGSANELFLDWREGLEARLRGDDLTGLMLAHLSKYRGLVPRLSLIQHLASGETGPILLDHVETAIRWAEFLEAHAHRAYGSATCATSDTAMLIMKKLKRNMLPTEFTSRDVYRPQWAGLRDREQVEAALALLKDCDWVMADRVETGGRPTSLWRPNPQAFKLVK